MTPLRADAARNRELLLQTAARLFEQEGLDVAMPRIAAEAGVGVGTLYRHFSDRQALVEAVYASEVDWLSDSDELLGGRTGAAALAEWMSRLLTYSRTKNGMPEAMKAVVAPASSTAATRGRIVAALQRILESGARDGTLRGDVDAEDVLNAVSGIFARTAQPDWPDRARSVVRIVLDGLGAGSSPSGRSSMTSTSSTP
jgi:AcrR family transcriptional regulator